MVKHFGERRDPSMGSWSADERKEADELKKAKRTIHRTTRDKIDENPEDALIAKIDAEKEVNVGNQITNTDRTSSTFYFEDVDDTVEEEQLKRGDA